MRQTERFLCKLSCHWVLLEEGGDQDRGMLPASTLQPAAASAMPLKRYLPLGYRSLRFAGLVGARTYIPL